MLSSYRTTCDAVADTLVRASTRFRSDQLAAYEAALQGESNEQARWVLMNILENAHKGESASLPLCDDTGIPHVFIEIGDEAELPVGFFAAVQEGIKEGLRRLPGRPMAVKGNTDAERIAQSAGLYAEPEKLETAPLQTKSIKGKKIRLTVLMLGGGPEIRGKTLPVFHQHSLDVVVDEMVSWAVAGASRLGCLPCVPAFGMGRTNLEAAVLAVEAMKEGNFLSQSPLEQKITAAVNDQSQAGPLGLGGRTTALATFIKVGPLRASGVRIVSLRLGCCFDPRRATYEWPLS